MPRSIVPAIAVTIFLLITLGLASHTTDSGRMTVTLRVTSSSEQTPITFNAACVFGENDPRAQFTKHRTPFEQTVSTKDGYVAGIFNAVEGSSMLKVEAVLKHDGETMNTISGTGSIIVLSTHRDFVGSGDAYEIHTF